MRGVEKETFAIGGTEASWELLRVGDNLEEVEAVLRRDHMEANERVVECRDPETHVDPFWAVWELGSTSESRPRLRWILSIHAPGVLVRYRAKQVAERCLQIAYRTSGCSQKGATAFAAWHKAGIDPASVQDGVPS